MPDSPPPIVMAHAQKPSDVGRWLARLLVDELHASKVHVRALDDAGSKLRLDALEPTAAQLVREAERVGLAKPALDPHMGHIAVSEASLHLLAGAHPPHALFSPCDRVMLAVSIARRPTFTAAHVAALPARASRRERAACVEGASICGACEAVGGVTLIAPHDQPRRAALQRQWLAPKAPATAVGVVRALTAQPHALIRAYFGPTEISFYFEFLGELSRALVGPAAAALVLAAVGAGANALLSAARAEVGRRALTAAYASGLIVWAAAFVEGWTRREKRRALESGTFTATDSDLAAAARAGFRGTELRCARSRCRPRCPLRGRRARPRIRPARRARPRPRPRAGSERAHSRWRPPPSPAPAPALRRAVRVGTTLSRIRSRRTFRRATVRSGTRSPCL